MIWIIISSTLYTLTVAIALFLISSTDPNVEASNKDAFFDIRNIGVALFWPFVLAGYGLWLGGKSIFKEKPKTENNVPGK